MPGSRLSHPRRRTVSVIIPAWNEQEGVGRTIASVTGAYEVIVVDGGSSDQTQTVARDAGATVLAAPRGRGIQLHVGAIQASGDILLFLHADCELGAGAMQQLVDLSATTDGSVYGAFRQKIKDSRPVYRLIEWGNNLRVTCLQLPYGDQGIFLDSQTYQACGGFPPVPLLEEVMLGRHARKFCRPHLLPGPISASSRRWRKYGVMRQTARNWSILAAFLLGVSPNRLAKWYYR